MQKKKRGKTKHEIPVENRPLRYEERTREFPRYRKSFQMNFGTKKLLTSLKLWVPLFCIANGALYLAEGNDPGAFYNNVPDPLKYALYVFAIIMGGWIGCKIFDRLDSNPTSDRGILGLKILSGLLLIAGVFILVFGIFYQTGLHALSFFRPTLSLARTTVSIFLIVLSMAFLLVGAYLLFKFERKSGIIVYTR